MMIVFASVKQDVSLLKGRPNAKAATGVLCTKVKFEVFSSIRLHRMQ